MLDINVKTIDGQNRSYSIPENYTVRQFKEKIANSLSIPVDRQRLIFQGRELKDANLLNEFDVNGKTLHLVQRAPPTANQQSGQPGQTHSNVHHLSNHNDVQQFVQQLIGGMHDVGSTGTSNQNEASTNSSTTINNDSNGMEVHIDLNNVSQIVNENEIRSRVRNIRRFLSLAQARLNRLQEIQSGAPLDDTSNSSIIVGSIHGTATLSDANGSIGTVGFDINHMPSGLSLPPFLLSAFQSNPFMQPNLNRPPTTTVTTGPVPVSAPTPTTVPASVVSSESTAAPTHILESGSAPTPATAPIATPILVSAPGTGISSAIHAAVANASQNRDFASMHAAIANAHNREAASIHAASVAAALQNAAVNVHQLASAPANTITTTTTVTTAQPITTTVTTAQPTTTTTTFESDSNTATTSTTTAATNDTATRRDGPASENRQASNNISVEVLADLINSVMESYTRFMPYLQQYHDMLVNDDNEPPESPNSSSTQTPDIEVSSNSNSRAANLSVINTDNSNIIVLGGGDNRRQRFCNNINDMMHLLGHLFHNLSDLHVNIRDRHPRQMHTMNSMQHTASAVISAAIPIEANFQIPFGSPTPPSTATDSATTSPNTPSTNLLNILNRIAPASTQPPPPTSGSSSIDNSATPGIPFNPFINIQSTTRRARPATSARVPRASSSSLPGTSSSPFQYSSNQNSYDQFLPCNSVHFYNTVNPTAVHMPPGVSSTSQRRRHPAGDQNNSSATPTPPPPPQGNTNQPINEISRIINNLITGAISRNQSGTATSGSTGGSNENISQNIRVNIGGMPGQISIATITSNGNNATGPPINPANLIEQLLGGLNGSTNRNSSTIQQQQQQQQPSAMVSALMREAINLMDSSNTNDQRLNQPLRELMRMFGEDDTEPSSAGTSDSSSSSSSSTLSIFNVLFSSMTLGDMINLARSQNRHEVFERSRQPLRNHIRTFLNGERTNDEAELSEQEVNGLIDRIYNDLFVDANGLNIDFTQFEMNNPQVNFAKSFEKLMKKHLKSMLNHVYDDRFSSSSSEQEETWSAVLFKKFQELIDQLVTLCRVCVKNADVKFTDTVSQKIREAVLSQNFLNNPMFHTIFENYVRTLVQQTLASISLSHSAVNEFIVYKNEEETASSSSREEKIITNENDEDSSSNRFDSASSTLSGNSMDIDQSFSEATTKTNLNTVLKKEEEGTSSTTETTILSREANVYRNVVPSDWMPTIERDIVTQHQQQQVKSFSDAYCSGMPAKRRKVLSSQNDLLNANLFKKVLDRTLEKTQLKANASQEEFVRESLNQSNLIESFSAEFDTAITERLRADPDFNKIINSDQTSPLNKDRFSYSKKRFN